MTEKELKKLNRHDLLEMLIFQTKRNAELEEKLKEATESLEKKNIVLNRSGSIAQASLRISGIFEAADEAAYRFLESVKANTAEDSEDPIDIFNSLKDIEEYREGRKTEVIISREEAQTGHDSDSADESSEEKEPCEEKSDFVPITSSVSGAELHAPVSPEELNSFFFESNDESLKDKSDEDVQDYYMQKARENAIEYEKKLKEEIDKKMKAYQDYVRDRFFNATKELDQLFSILSRDEFTRITQDVKKFNNEIWDD